MHELLLLVQVSRQSISLGQVLHSGWPSCWCPYLCPPHGQRRLSGWDGERGWGWGWRGAGVRGGLGADGRQGARRQRCGGGAAPRARGRACRRNGRRRTPGGAFRPLPTVTRAVSGFRPQPGGLPPPAAAGKACGRSPCGRSPCERARCWNSDSPQLQASRSASRRAGGGPPGPDEARGAGPPVGAAARVLPRDTPAAPVPRSRYATIPTKDDPILFIGDLVAVWSNSDSSSFKDLKLVWEKRTGTEFECCLRASCGIFTSACSWWCHQVRAREDVPKFGTQNSQIWINILQYYSILHAFNVILNWVSRNITQYSTLPNSTYILVSIQFNITQYYIQYYSILHESCNITHNYMHIG